MPQLHSTLGRKSSQYLRKTKIAVFAAQYKYSINTFKGFSKEKKTLQYNRQIKTSIEAVSAIKKKKEVIPLSVNFCLLR